MTELTQEIVRKFFDYNPSTGILAWKDPMPRDMYSTERGWRIVNARNAGKRAGGVRVNERGYRRRTLSILGKVRSEHRIIWLWMTGVFPEEVDHINRDATDNRWDNLREVSRIDNARNSSIASNNCSGFSGVSWRKDGNKWHARGSLKNKDVHLGFFKEFDQAVAAVEAFRIENGYSSGHGGKAKYHS